MHGLLVLAALSLDLCRGLPRLQFDGGGARIRRGIIGNTGVDYLTRFGYLPQSILETGALTTDIQLRNAVRNLQSYGGIPQTGEIDAATIELMSRKRCGVHDVSTGFRNRKKRYTLQGEKWHSTNLSWSVQKVDEIPGLRGDDVIRELNKALSVWSANTVLNFQFRGNSSSADILVSFHSGYHGDGYPFDGSGSVLAHAFFPGIGRGGDAHFDVDENWSVSRGDKAESTSLYAVALHEFGHSLGLSHSSVPGSVMFPWYSDSNPTYHLPEDDIRAIQHLYGYPDNRPKYPVADPNIPKAVPPPVTTSTTPLPPSTTTPAGPYVPSMCETNFDAVAVIRSEMWAFKGRYFWRIHREGGTREDPVELGLFWYGLPSTIDHVDAVYEKQNHDIVFFVGQQYFIMSGNSQLKQGPHSLTRLGLPATLKKIDGAMKWGYNQKTYFFSGDMYWRFDDETNSVELDYPRDISMWKGVPHNIDAVFQYTDKKTYFFKNQYFWEFDDIKMEVVKRDPTPVGEYWFHCPKLLHNKDDPVAGSKSTISSPIFVFLTLLTLVS